MKLNRAVWYSGLAAMATFALLARPASDDQRPQPAKPSPAPKAPAALRTNTLAVTDHPIVGYIEKRGRTIVIKSSPKGPLYTVRTTEGKLLFENLTANQLQAKAPELHEFLKTALAHGKDKGAAKVDASLRLGSP